MVEDVEELGTKLQRDSLIDLEALEEREVKTMKARTEGGGRSAAQDLRTGKRNAASWGVRNRSVKPELAGLLEGGGISEPTQRMVGIGMQAEFRILTRKQERVASGSRGRVCGTSNADWLATLKGDKIVETPATHDIIRKAVCRSEELLSFADGKLIATAEMEDVANVERCKPPVDARTETWYIGSAEACDAASVEQIAGVGEGLGVGVGDEITKAVR